MAGETHWSAVQAAALWLHGRSPDELDILEFGGRAAYLDEIRRRDPKTGEVQATKVRLWPPSHLDKAKARIDALEWVKEITRAKVRPTWEAAAKELGGDYVDQLDTVCLLARCTRDHDAPEHQHLDHHELDARYGRASLMDLWDRLNHLDAMSNPQADELSEEQFWALVTAIDRKKNVGPLVVISGLGRDSFVLSMACRLASYRRDSSSSPSTVTS